MNALDIYSVRPGDLQSVEEEVRQCEDAWRKAGGVAVADAQVEQARRHAQRLQGDLDRADALSRPGVRLRFYRFIHLLGRLGVARCGKWRFFGIVSAVALGLSMPAVMFVTPTLTADLIVSAFLTLLSAAAAAAVVIGCWPDEPHLRTYQQLQAEWLARKRQAEALRPSAQRAWAGYESLASQQALFDRLERARRRKADLVSLLASAKYRLLHTDWRALKDVAFEQFLADVFHALGYGVQTTRGSGDQGVDLIVTGKGRRIAVQAKGYTGNVGNHAVMEVVAGMTFYRCDSCVVVTNSSFTRHAQELAAGVGCRLVDGGEIPDLIEGRIY
jgi:HJR/Mrr/RecB family endonuclease